MTTTPSVERLTAEHVLAAIEAATKAATEDGPGDHPAAKRDATMVLYLRALGLGVALIGAELAGIRDELASLTRATYTSGGV
jgi:hypothetical protein